MRPGRSTRREEDAYNWRTAYEDYTHMRDTLSPEVRDMRHDTLCRREIIRLQIPREERYEAPK